MINARIMIGYILTSREYSATLPSRCTHQFTGSQDISFPANLILGATLKRNRGTAKPATTKKVGSTTHVHQADAINGLRPTDHPRRVVQGPLYSPRWANFFIIMAFLVFLVILSISLAAPNFSPFDRGRNVLVGAFAVLPLFHIAIRLKAKGPLQTLQSDRRAPVLYLRSFVSDMIDNQSNTWLGIPSEEDVLVESLEQIGPVLAIGRPGEKLSTTGSARLYVTDDDWQAIAGKLMASARLVVIRAGSTPGVRWELERVRQKLPAEKVVLWFPARGLL
jgi:hypothetical protein